MSAYGPYDDSAILPLEALSASGTPEERAYDNEWFRALGRKFVQYLRFEGNAERAWDDWLATTRIARPENDDAPAP